MYCPYGIDNCDHSKCFRCGECTNGSQVHRVCLNEVQDLYAGPEECLPTEDEDTIQSDTEVDEAEDWMAFEEAYIEAYTYQFYMEATSTDLCVADLAEMYTGQGLEHYNYTAMRLHRYLTSRMDKSEFFMAYTQWREDIIHHPKEDEIRMKQPVLTKMVKGEHCVYHGSCVQHDNLTSNGYSEAILTVKARDAYEFIELMTEGSRYFFCNRCDRFMYDDVCYYPTSVWNTEFGPECTHMLYSVTTLNTDEETYTTLYAHKLIGIVYSQAPPKKRRRLFYE